MEMTQFEVAGSTRGDGRLTDEINFRNRIGMNAVREERSPSHIRIGRGPDTNWKSIRLTPESRWP